LAYADPWRQTLIKGRESGLHRIDTLRSEAVKLFLSADEKILCWWYLLLEFMGEFEGTQACYLLFAPETCPIVSVNLQYRPIESGTLCMIAIPQ
jgi:hypothetical protein